MYSINLTSSIPLYFYSRDSTMENRSHLVMQLRITLPSSPAVHNSAKYERKSFGELTKLNGTVGWRSCQFSPPSVIMNSTASTLELFSFYPYSFLLFGVSLNMVVMRMGFRCLTEKINIYPGIAVGNERLRGDREDMKENKYCNATSTRVNVRPMSRG